MNKKIGRNDPCPCGSGKKYKSCCWGERSKPRKLTAKWINAPQQEEEEMPAYQGPDLMERAFGKAVADAGETPPETSPEEEKEDTGESS